MVVNRIGVAVALNLPSDTGVMTAQAAANLAKAQAVQIQMIDDIAFMLAKVTVGHDGKLLIVWFRADLTLSVFPSCLHF
jgi:hypothetical protein